MYNNLCKYKQVIICLWDRFSIDFILSNNSFLSILPFLSFVIAIIIIFVVFVKLSKLLLE